MSTRKLSQMEAKVFAVYLMLKEVRKQAQKEELERQRRKPALLLIHGGKKD